ncbi:MAG: ATP-binding cassette domain-containing protein [Synechococcus sp.]|nr:ATP-binding cassette domain-containing protein [Synechococcus sp.]
MNSSTVLEFRNVSLRGRETPRLDNLSLRIEAGELIALLGPSGAGKSSLLAVANGSLRPDGGQVLWNNTPVHQLKRQQRRTIGTLWQDLRLVEELSVAQNVNSGALGRRSLGWALANLLWPIERNACLLCLSQAGLPATLLDRPVTSLSGGQRQRVALARLFRQRPEFVLADEPLSSLDPALVHELLNMLLRRDPINDHDVLPSTTMICLHRPDLIGRFDRVIGLRQGRVALDASPDSVTACDLGELYALPARTRSDGQHP